MKKIKLFVLFLLTISCSQTKTFEQKNKEIELLKRELEVTRKENELTKKEIQKNIPVDFLKNIGVSSPIQKIIELFGSPKKIYTPDANNNYYQYFYDLNNAYLLVESTDNIKISAISIESKNLEPYIEIGTICPVKFETNKNLYLGKSKFLELNRQDNIEISRDRCNSLGFIVDYGAGPCNYNYYIYGNIIDYEKFEIDHSKLINGQNFFESSYGKLTYKDFESQIINYIVFTDNFDLFNSEHYYGQGIHCDYIYR